MPKAASIFAGTKFRLSRPKMIRLTWNCIFADKISITNSMPIFLQLAKNFSISQGVCSNPHPITCQDYMWIVEYDEPPKNNVAEVQGFRVGVQGVLTIIIKYKVRDLVKQYYFVCKREHNIYSLRLLRSLGREVRHPLSTLKLRFLSVLSRHKHPKALFCVHLKPFYARIWQAQKRGWPKGGGGDF